MAKIYLFQQLRVCARGSILFLSYNKNMRTEELLKLVKDRKIKINVFFQKIHTRDIEDTLFIGTMKRFSRDFFFKLVKHRIEKKFPKHEKFEKTALFRLNLQFHR